MYMPAGMLGSHHASASFATHNSDIRAQTVSTTACVSRSPRLTSQVCSRVTVFPAMAGVCCKSLVRPVSSLKQCQGERKMRHSSYLGCVPLPFRRPQILEWRAERVIPLAMGAASGETNGSPDASGGGRSHSSRAGRTRVKNEVESVRSKITGFVEKKAGYFWLGGPILITAAVTIPSAVVSLIDLLQQSYWLGLAATFGLDILFVLSADLFFVLADKAGHHQEIPGGPPPYVGPWEYTGYPKGEPSFSKFVSYAGVGIAVLGILVSLFLGKVAVALPALGSYLALIFIQVAYERLLNNDRVPVYPLVPIVYTVYRFRQLARGMELVAAMGGGTLLAWTIRLLMVVWTLYLGMHLTQLPWLYSTWNSNRVT